MEEIIKRGKDYSRFIAIFLTIIILGVLVISGPANAFSLSLNVPFEGIQRGKIVSFIASVNLDQDEKVDINYLTLKLNGTSNIIGRKDLVLCKFKPDGDLMNVNACKGIKIEKIEIGNYGYGYDTHKESYVYNITIDTDEYLPGIYKTGLSILSKGEFYEQDGNDLNIISNATLPPLKDCSIRGKDGITFVEEKDFGNKSKINFFIPLKNARSGTGYITGQKGRTTFSYEFTVNDVIDDGRNSTIIVVDGKYKIGIGKEKNEKSFIILDKNNNKISVLGENINVVFNDIDLKNKCYFEKPK